MPSKPFAGLAVGAPKSSTIKRRYSVTADVVNFRRCPRQYGTFNVQKYAPAHQTQLYFGTIIHQVLDRCHAHYHGLLDPALKGSIPDHGLVLDDSTLAQYFDDALDAARAGSPAPAAPSDVVRYFSEVEKGLISQNIRAITPDLRLKALRILQYFNRLEGPSLYPRVVDTEHLLQADRGNHVLHGVVDLLADTAGASGDPGEREMWDYKGTSRLALTPKDRETYEFQMRVYAHLYQLKNGVPPKRAMLYFLNELDGPSCPTTRPVNAIMEVSLDPSDISVAIAEFTRTVTDIEAARTIDQWNPAAIGCISDQDCAICDLRWDCPTPNGGKGVPMRYP